MSSRGRLFLRSTLSFAALPGIVAYVVPFLLAPRAAPAAGLRPAGYVLVALGSVVLFWCVRDFHAKGHGTLAPWDPPPRLVVTGLYRYSRNPMYVGVLLVLVGWAVLFESRTHWVYAAAMAIAFHLRIVCSEEPWLARTHAERWTQYKASVPRWIGRPRRRID